LHIDKKFNKVAYDNKFIAEKYDRINLTIRKGQKEIISAHADKHGESVNAFISRAIAEAMERDNIHGSNQESK
jgi:uncharacterized protein (DUF1778 family)